MAATFDIKVLEEKKNLLINREELQFKVEFFGKGTPNRLDVKKKLAALRTSKEKLTIITKLRPYFGVNYVKGKAHIYEDAKELQFYEPFFTQVRNIPKDKRQEIYKLKKEKKPYLQLFEY